MFFNGRKMNAATLHLDCLGSITGSGIRFFSVKVTSLCVRSLQDHPQVWRFIRTYRSILRGEIPERIGTPDFSPFHSSFALSLHWLKPTGHSRCGGLLMQSRRASPRAQSRVESGPGRHPDQPQPQSLAAASPIRSHNTLWVSPSQHCSGSHIPTHTRLWAPWGGIGHILCVLVSSMPSTC